MRINNNNQKSIKDSYAVELNNPFGQFRHRHRFLKILRHRFLTILQTQLPLVQQFCSDLILYISFKITIFQLN